MTKEIAKNLPLIGAFVMAVVVLLDILGAIDVIDDDSRDTRRATRLPAEYLYLDDERVDAYLGQLRRGLSPTETRSRSMKRTEEAKLGAAEVAQVGATRELQETIEETVSLRAADRYYELENELGRFRVNDAERRRDDTFRPVAASGEGCGLISTRRRVIGEGDIVRITGAQLLAPTYVLPLAKVAHAAQYRPPKGRKRGVRVTRGALTQLARSYRKPLARYLRRFGANPRLPLRLAIKPGCAVLLPTRYSKLTEAPSLLTGSVTIVGKVVRRLTPTADPRYVDVETAVTYGAAVRRAHKAIKRVLQLEGPLGTAAVSASAVVEYPGLVVLPLAMYK